MFIPQGWRHDLVGIDPAEQWAVMQGLAQHADAGPWESIWVYDHFHTVPAPDRRGDARGVDADGRVRRGHRAGPARPDVHVHELPQPGLPGEGRRHATSSPAAGSRWASAPAGTSTSGAPTATASRRRRERLRHARRGRADHAPGLDDGSATSTGKHYQVDGAHRAAAAAAGGRHPAVDRRRRREGDAARSPRSTRSTPTSTAPWRASRTSPSCCAGHCRDRRHRLRRDRPVGQLQRGRSAATEAEVQDRTAGREGPPRAATSATEKAEATARRGPRDARVRHAGADRREAAARWRRRAWATASSTSRGRLRPQRHRAVRAGGRPRTRGRHPVNPGWLRGGLREYGVMRVAIVGAGPTGLYTSLALARRGHAVVVVDRDTGPAPDGQWRRAGVMQFHHPHAFRSQVGRRAAGRSAGGARRAARGGRRARGAPGPAGAGARAAVSAHDVRAGAARGGGRRARCGAPPRPRRGGAHRAGAGRRAAGRRAAPRRRPRARRLRSGGSPRARAACARGGRRLRDRLRLPPVRAAARGRARHDAVPDRERGRLPRLPHDRLPARQRGVLAR